jgi:dienelactone hydrolase
LKRAGQRRRRIWKNSEVLQNGCVGVIGFCLGGGFALMLVQAGAVAGTRLQ